MKLKLMIDRFAIPENDGIEVPIIVTTSFDASGITQMRSAVAKAETSFKKMASSPSSGAISSITNKFKAMSAPVSAAFSASLASLTASLRTQGDQYYEKRAAGRKPKGTLSSMFTKQERRDRITAGNEAYLDSFYSTISKTNPLVEALGTNLQSAFTGAVGPMQELNTSSEKVNSSLEKMQKSSTKANTGLKGLSSVIRGSVLIQIQALYHVLRRAFSFMTSSFQAAGDFVESVNLYTMSVGEYAEAGKEWANQISDALYLDTAEIYQYTGQFFNLTRGLGATAEAADLMSRNLTQLTYDMASYLNIDVDTANTKLMSAMSGQTKAVTSVGIAVQSASLQELAYSLNINKSVQEMTQAEKTYLRYIQIMRSTTQMQGDLGRTIITPANAMRLLRTQLNLLSRAIGQVFTPIIMQALPVVIAFTQVLTELAQSLAAALGYKLEDFLAPASSVNALADGFGDLADEAGKAADKVNSTLAPFDELNVVANESKSSGAGAGGNSVLSDLGQYLDGYDMLQFYTDSMKNKIEGIKRAIKSLAPILGAVFGLATLANFLTKLGKIGDKFNFLKKPVEQLSTKWSKFGTIMKKTLFGTAGLIVGSALAYDGMKKLAKETGNATINMVEFGAGVATAAASGALIGSNFGLAGTVIGGFTGLVISGLSALSGYTDGLQELREEAARKEIFGNIVISTKNFEDMMYKLGGTTRDSRANLDEFANTIASTKESFDEGIGSLESYVAKFGMMGTEITEESGQQLKDAMEQVFSDANKIIDDSSKQALEILSTSFKQGTSLTEEEQQNLLKSVETNGNKRKEKVQGLENQVYDIYNKGMQDRGYLTDQEKQNIEDLLEEIDELVNRAATQTETDLLAAQSGFNDKSLGLAEESYDNLATAADNYTNAEKEKALKNYNEMYNLAQNNAYDQISILKEQYSDQSALIDEAWKYKVEGDEKSYAYAIKSLKQNGVDIEKEMNNTYKTMKTLQDDANKNYKKAEEEWNKTTSDAMHNYSVDIWNRLKDLGFKLDGESRAQRKILMGIVDKLPDNAFDGINKQFEEEGKRAGEAFARNVKNGMSIFDAIKEYKSTISGFTAKKYATGGFPETGEMFVAREDGPELIGKIGSKTAVANNDQITSALTNALMVALNGTSGNKQPSHTTVYIGNKKVFDGMGDYIDSENDRYGTNYVRV